MNNSVTVTVVVRAEPEAAFRMFTGEIEAWWKRGPQYRSGDGVLRFDSDRLLEGDVELGRVLAWEPGRRLLVEFRNWRLSRGEPSEVEVRFEAVGDGTRVTVHPQRLGSTAHRRGGVSDGGWPLVGDAAGGVTGTSQAGAETLTFPCSTIRTGALLTKTDLKETPETPDTPETGAATPSWLIAVRAAEAKKATDIKVLDLTGITSFADYFVIATGSNQRQIQAIADEVGMQLKHVGERPISVEGYEPAEWVLLDYADLLVHVFSTKAREYYDLERLWRNARTVEIPPE